MKTEYAKRDHSRIALNYRETKKAMAFVASKPIHSARVIERQTFAAVFMAIYAKVKRFFGWFGRTSNTSYKPFVYTKPCQQPTPKCLRFGVYMRRRGRKYKKACA